MLYRLGVETGLRISDILSITSKNLHEDFLTVIEQKTGKEKTAHISKDISDYIHSFNGEKPFKMSRQAAWKYFKRKAKKLRLKRVGTHSMRKKYAYEVYKKTRKFTDVQKALNHDFLGTTMVYLIDEDSL